MPSTAETGTSDLLTRLQTYSALFLLGIKEGKKLTQTAVQGIVEGITDLSQFRLDILRQEIYHVLAAAGVSPSSIPGLEKIFDSQGPFGRPFIGLETEYQQVSFYKRNFKSVVSPNLYNYLL